MKKVMMVGVLLGMVGSTNANTGQPITPEATQQASKQSTSQPEYGCEQLVYDYGVSSSGQAQCGFRKYNKQVIAYATQCFAIAKQTGQQTQLENILAAGIEQFNQSFSQAKDKRMLCDALLQSYPNFVAK